MYRKLLRNTAALVQYNHTKLIQPVLYNNSVVQYSKHAVLRYMSSDTTAAASDSTATIKDADIVDDNINNNNDHTTATDNKPNESDMEQMTQQMKDLFKDMPQNNDQSADTPKEKITITHNEKIHDTTKSSKQSFQAETRQLLDIVTNSLYTDKDVFLRELISNSSDACEKLRYYMSSKPDQLSHIPDDTELNINILLDVDKKQLVIQDNGIGMTRSELIDNIGTIAKSGSKSFVADQSTGDSKSNIIGQFGVGFYSSFMVGSQVDVYTRSTLVNEPTGTYWSSDGLGEYTVNDADNVEYGTKIIIHLRDSVLNEFNNEYNIKRIIEKYSNFINFPIYFQKQRISTIGAIWCQSNVSDELYNEFYKTALKSYDTPAYRLHFHSDVPLQIHALFYFPSTHNEKFNMGRLESQVSLYSKKVLINNKSSDILPSWLRFIKGVVDSEDIPLNVSRESNQNTALLSKINNVLTKRIIKYLNESMKSDTNKYMVWYNEFAMFLKEGVCTDYTNMYDIAKLLKYETSDDTKSPDNTVQQYTFDEYISRMSTQQKSIYYLNVPNRQYALQSPYYEALKSKKLEVIFLYNPIDDFVVKNLQQINGRKFISIDSTECTDELDTMLTSEEKQQRDEQTKQSNESNSELIKYIESILSDKVSSVKLSTRTSSSPCMIVDSESAAIRKMMQFAEQNNSMKNKKQKLELHINHPIIQQIIQIRESKPDLCKLVVEQIYDNACIAADVLDNPRSMLTRLNELLLKTTQQ